MASTIGMSTIGFIGLATPHIARAIVFLASPAAEAINGAAIPVYGRS